MDPSHFQPIAEARLEMMPYLGAKMNLPEHGGDRRGQDVREIEYRPQRAGQLVAVVGEPEGDEEGEGDLDE